MNSIKEMVVDYLEMSKLYFYSTSDTCTFRGNPENGIKDLKHDALNALPCIVLYNISMEEEY